MADLAGAISTLFEQGSAAPRDAARAAFLRLRAELAAGRVRAAEPDAASPGGWRANAWVAQGLLLGLRVGERVDMGIGKGRWPFFDDDTMPLKTFDPADDVRIAPGGSSVREGAYLGAGVVCLPPMYVNVGAYVDAGTHVDSHALVGACAQVGRHVRLGPAAQIGGALAPGALPAVVEDEVRIGGGCGVYPGVVVQRRAVLAAGTILTGAAPIYDLPNARIIAREPGMPLVVPAGAVVVPGARAVTAGAGKSWGLSLAAPVIVRYRDEGSGGETDADSEADIDSGTTAEIERWLR